MGEVRRAIMFTRNSARSLSMVVILMAFSIMLGCADGGVEALPDDVDLTAADPTIDFTAGDTNLHEDPDVTDEIVYLNFNLAELSEVNPVTKLDAEVLKNARDSLMAGIADQLGSLEGKKKTEMMEFIRKINPDDFVEINEMYMLDKIPGDGVTDPSPIEYDPDMDKLTQEAQTGNAALVNEGAMDVDVAQNPVAENVAVEFAAEQFAKGIDPMNNDF